MNNTLPDSEADSIKNSGVVYIYKKQPKFITFLSWTCHWSGMRLTGFLFQGK